MTNTSKKHATARAVASLFVIGSLGACGTVKNDVQQLDDHVSTKLTAAQEKVAAPVPVVTRDKGAFVMGQVVQVAPPRSPILDRQITYVPTKRVTLADVASYINLKFSLSIDTSEVWSFTNSTVAGSPQGAPQPTQQVVPNLAGQLGSGQAAPNSANGMPLLTVDYEGTLSGLLDDVANKSGVWWKLSEGKITFFRSETETFYIPASAKKSKSSSTIAANANTGGSSGGTGSTTSTSSGGASSTSDNDIDLWTDLAATAKTVGGAATVAVNRAVGSITVTGSPTQVRNVRDWVKSLTDNLSQQVVITVHTYKVNLNKEDNYSWNPNLAFSALSAQYGINVTGPQVPAVVSGMTPLSLTTSILKTATGEASQYSGSQFAFQALSTIGTIIEEDERSATSMNGRTATIQIANVDTYLASSTPGASVAVGATPLPPTLTPGTLTTGFMGSFTPKVVNGKVIMDVDMNTTTDRGMSKAGTDTSFIQTPKWGVDASQQSVSLTPGQALFLTGIRQTTGKTNQSGTGSADNYWAGGGRGDSTGRTLTAILITAKVQ